MKPVALLLLGLAHTYLWQLSSKPGYVFNLTGALLSIALLLLVARDQSFRLVCLLLALFQGVVAGCNGWMLVRPWKAVPGQSCTAMAGLPFEVLGALLALYLVVKVAREQHDRNSG